MPEESPVGANDLGAQRVSKRKRSASPDGRHEGKDTPRKKQQHNVTQTSRSVAGPNRPISRATIPPEGAGQHPVRNSTTAVPISLTCTFSTSTRTDPGTAASADDKISEGRSQAIWNMASGTPLQMYVRLLVNSK